MELPARKHIRLKSYDYAIDGSYFVTICTNGKRKILSAIEEKVESDGVSVGRFALGLPHNGTFVSAHPRLTEKGLIVQKYIENVSSVYDGVNVDKYVIMPNHVHAIITICRKSGGTRASRPTETENGSCNEERKRAVGLFTVIESIKSLSSRETSEDLWQDSFYETVIRYEAMYERKWRYIEENPYRWNDDEYSV